MLLLGILLTGFGVSWYSSILTGFKARTELQVEQEETQHKDVQKQDQKRQKIQLQQQLTVVINFAPLQQNVENEFSKNLC